MKQHCQYLVADLLRTMERLRDPEHGCPWDIQQDFKSIVPSTLEECYELADAIEHEDYDHVAEELGDVLFQVIFYSQLGREQNLFSFGEVVSTLVDKLIRRHPHVFADGDLEGVVENRSSVTEVKQTWEVIKQAERDSKQQSQILSDVPIALPALPRAQKLQKRVAQVNFDWPDASAVLDKLQEEVDELRVAVASAKAADIHDEMGDVLFTCVNLARHLGLDAEETLRQSSTKFEKRFSHMEAAAEAGGRALDALSQEQLDQLWSLAKQWSAVQKGGL